MIRTYRFTAEIVVHDLQQLYDAALEHAQKVDGISCELATENLHDEDGEIDVASCISMIMDPGSIVGCDIRESSTECVHVGHGGKEE